MKDNEKQVFTRREIEIDLKNIFKRNMFSAGIVFVIGLFATVLGLNITISSGEFNIFIVICDVVSTIACLLCGCVLVRSIYVYFKPLKYEIVSDIYQYTVENDANKFLSFYVSPVEGMINMKLGGADPCLGFKTYGEYRLIRHYNVFYYKWSKACCTRGFEMRQCIAKDDEYYLIIINNRIAYIYSKRVFEFKETK